MSKRKLSSYKPTYNYCQICGRRPGKNEEMNWGPIRFWEPDDGWKIGTLCRWCFDDYAHKKPSTKDFAYEDFYGEDGEMTRFVGSVDTDEDPIIAFMEVMDDG